MIELKDKLPQSITSAVDVLQWLNPKAPYELLLLLFETKISHFLCSNGYRIIGSSLDLVPPNIYGLVFMRSGGGKNKPLNDIHKIFFDTWYKEHQLEWEKWKEQQEFKIEEDADKMYKGAGAKKQEYIERHAPRALLREIGDATPEGFIADREMLQSFGRGATYLFISEFADYITNLTTTRDQLLTLVKEAYDIGDTLPKVIKGNKSAQAITGVPSVALFTSDPEGLQTGANADKLKVFMGRGYARRAFVLAPPRKDKITMEDKRLERQIMSEVPEIAKIYAEHVKQISENKNKNISLSPEVVEMLDQWEVDLYNTAGGLHGYEQTEQENRQWKTLKLAGVFAVWDQRNIIEMQHMEAAIAQANYSAKEIQKITNAEDKDILKLYEYAISQKVFVKGDLRNEGFVNKNYFSRWVDEALDQLTYKLNQVNLDLYEHKGKRNITIYQVDKLGVKPSDIAELPPNIIKKYL